MTRVSGEKKPASAPRLEDVRTKTSNAASNRQSIRASRPLRNLVVREVVVAILAEQRQRHGRRDVVLNAGAASGCIGAITQRYSVRPRRWADQGHGFAMTTGNVMASMVIDLKRGSRWFRMRPRSSAIVRDDARIS